MNLHEQIEAAVKGEKSDATIYWDRQDTTNVGPAYRCGQESGSLTHTGWSGDAAGYNIADYFCGPDGAYRGPDKDGIYPILEAE